MTTPTPVIEVTEEQLPPRVNQDHPPRRAPRRDRRESQRTSTTPPSETPYKRGAISDGLSKTYMQIAMAVGFLGDQECAGVLAANAESMALSMEKWAQENESVRRVLTKLLQTTTVGEVIAAHAPVIAAIVMHHSPLAKKTPAPVTTPEEPLV